RAVLPSVLELDAIHAAEVDLVEAAGDGIKAGRVNDDVEFIFRGAGLDALRRDPLDRRFRDVHQLDIVLVVDLVIESLERQPSGAEAVVPWDQLFRDLGIPHPLANLPRHEIANRRVRLPVDQDVAEIALPDAEAALGIELFVESFALRVCDLESPARVRRVQEAGEGLL